MIKSFLYRYTSFDSKPMSFSLFAWTYWSQDALMFKAQSTSNSIIKFETVNEMQI